MNSPMMRPMLRPTLLALVGLLALATTATAAPKKKYYFELAAVTAKPEVKAASSK